MREGGTHHELTTHLLDLASKWTKECTTVRDVVEVIMKEQLLDTMPASICGWCMSISPSTVRRRGSWLIIMRQEGVRLRAAGEQER